MKATYHVVSFGYAEIDVDLFDKWYRSEHSNEYLKAQVEELLELPPVEFRARDITLNWNRIDFCLILSDAGHTP